MNKTELAAAVATTTGKTKADVAEIVNAVFNTIQDTVATGEDVVVIGFGKFERVHRPARTAKNPSTGEDVDVAESHAPKFRPGAGFKDVVNSGGRTLVNA
ncbi:HU family DNA-binding protein [Nonomuraea sp. NPDC049714]|uniref:HU family DNA-binding protein n=1 Tax=Nonomuraea sp. NPDC049714 TaxID=3364357 RepID=UPI00379B45AB